MIERWIAKLGVVGVLAILLTLSVLLNLWQFNRAGKADARCETRNAQAAQVVREQADERDGKALEIADEAADDAQESVQVIEKETIRYVDRIRREAVEVPANCPRTLPSGVRDTLADAATAANRPL
jgi:N-acetylglucosamine kinase-like BadF-type ATPase